MGASKRQKVRHNGDADRPIDPDLAVIKAKSDAEFSKYHKKLWNLPDTMKVKAREEALAETEQLLQQLPPLVPGMAVEFTWSSPLSILAPGIKQGTVIGIVPSGLIPERLFPQLSELSVQENQCRCIDEGTTAERVIVVCLVSLGAEFKTKYAKTYYDPYRVNVRIVEPQ